MTDLQVKERRVAAYMDEANDKIADATRRSPGEPDAVRVELLETARALVRAAAREAASLSRIHWLRRELEDMAGRLGMGDPFATPTKAVA